MLNSRKNAIIIEMKIPITQSESWHKLQKALGKTSFLTKESDFQYLAILSNTPVGNYLYCPYGPCYDTSEGFNLALSSLRRLATQHNAFFIRIEPQDPDYKNYAPKNSRTSHDLNPKETWQLKLDSEDLQSKLPSRLLRYHKNAAKKGITIETSHRPEDIKYLIKLQHDLAKQKGISTFSERYLRTELAQPFATLYLVKYHPREEAANSPSTAASNNHAEKSSEATEQILAAGLVFDDATTRYNLQGAQSDEGRKLHATGILTIQLILDAEKKGLKTFDFWGIAPEGAGSDHPWAGFTNFKKTFDGYEQDYAGTHDIVLKPARYKLYQILRKIRRSV